MRCVSRTVFLDDRFPSSVLFPDTLRVSTLICRGLIAVASDYQRTKDFQGLWIESVVSERVVYRF